MPETRDGRAYKRYTVELHPDVDARFPGLRGLTGAQQGRRGPGGHRGIYGQAEPGGHPVKHRIEGRYELNRPLRREDPQ